MSKPKPQELGVSGIEATPITMNEPQELDVEAVLHGLSAHPPFQMFIHERHKNDGTDDSQQFAYDKAKETVFMQGIDTLLEAYEQWHTEKGYWPNETPAGELKIG